MASEIKIGLNVSSNGTTEAETRKARALKAAYDDAARSASGMGGGTAGSRAAAAMATRGTAGSGSTTQEYGQLRGTAGVTGASARDFANQAQGLGGLVRVYATFAANLFAVSAAFNALREAAQTQQLIRGLDQLGAQSGRALGALSKQLVEVTGGAISMREAMTAVAQASSAGLTNTQIKNLAVVANQASQALGINMSDALNRLSRGISKIEPELLDELGIFVRVDTAVQQYALNIGKTATSLSEFERRQAFANAVLEQGQKKFGAISSQANPYDKLLASSKDLLTSGLNLLNKVLEPIVKLLAESPGALIAVFAGIGALLLKQAIPALGQFRAGLRASAEEAANAAKAFRDSFGDKFQGILEAQFDLPKLKRELATIQASAAKIGIPSTLSAATRGNIAALGGADEAAAEQAASRLNKVLDQKNKIVETGIKGRRQASEAEIAATKAEIAAIQVKLQEYNAIKNLVQREAAAQSVADKPLGLLDPQIIAARTYAKLQKDLDKSTAVSNAAIVANVSGIRSAWILLNKEVSDKGLTGLDKWTTLAKGGTAAVLTRITGIIGAFSEIGMILAAVGALFQAFDSFASNATEQQNNLNKEIKNSAESIAALNKTVEEYTIKRKEGFSFEGVVAFNQSLQGITNSLQDQLLLLDEYRKKADVWDNTKDIFSGIFNKSNLDQIKKSAGETGQAIIKSLNFSSRAPLVRQQLAEALKIPVEALDNAEQYQAAIKKLSEADLRNLSLQFKDIAKEQNAAIGSIQAFKESLTGVGKLFDQLVQSNAFTDIQGKLGVELVEAANRLGQAIETDLLGTLTNLNDLVSDPKFLSAISTSPDLLEGARQVREAYEEINKTLRDQAEAQTKAQVAAQAARNVQTGQSMAIGPVPNFRVTEADLEVARTQRAVRDQARQAADQMSDVRNRAQGIVNEFVKQNGIIEKIANAGFDRIQLALNNAAARAGIDIAESRAQRGKSVGLDTSSLEYKLTSQRLELDRAQIRASSEAQKALEANTDAVIALNASISAGNIRQQLQENDRRVQQNQQFPNQPKQEVLTDTQKSLLRAQLKEAERTAQSAMLRSAVRTSEANRTAIPEGLGTADEIAQARAAVARKNRVIDLKEQGQLAATNAKQTQAQDQREIASREFINKIKQEENKLDVLKVGNQNQLLQLLKSLSGEDTIRLAELTRQGELRKNELEEQGELKNLADRRTELEDSYKKILASNVGLSAEVKKELENSLIAQRNLLTGQESQVRLARGLKDLQAEIALLDRQAAISTAEITKRQQIQNTLAEQRLAVAQNARKIQREEFDARLALGDISERFLTQLKTQRDLEDESLRFEQERKKILDDIELKEKAVTDAKARQAIIDSKVLPYTTAGIAVPPELAAAQASAATGVSNAQTQLDLQKGALDVAKQINEQTIQSITNQGRLNEQLAITKDLVNNIKTLGETFSAAFGTFGDKLANAANTIANAYQAAQVGAIATEAQLKNIDGRIAAIGSNIDSLPDPEGQDKDAYKKLFKEQTALNKDRESAILRQQNLEVAAAAKVLGATKSLFKEKTAAYKIFAALEKAAHVVSIGLQLKELATKLFVDKSKVASGVATGAAEVTTEAGTLAAKTPFMITGIMGKVISQLGWWGVPIAAAIVAAIFGRGSPKMPAGITAAERQEVQGTGQTYMNGELVRREGGVLGNDKEVADSITSSIDILKQEFYGLMGSGSSRIVRALEDINKNTGNTVKVLLAELSIMAPNAKVPGFMSPSTGSPMTNALNTAGAIGGGVAGGYLGAAYGGAVASWAIGAQAGSWAGPVGMVVGAILGAVLGSMLSSTKTSIIDEGIRVAGNLSGLTQGQGSFQQYQTAKIESRFLWMKDSKIVDVPPVSLSPAIVKAVSDTFAGFQEVLIASAIALEGPATAAIERIKAAQVELKVSLQGLSAEEAAKKIAAELSVELNRITGEIFPYIEQFRQIGEEYFETIARIVKDSEVLVMGLELVGISLGKFNTTEQRLRFEQDFINNLLGGAEAAAKKFESYYDTFLTPQEKFRVRFNMLTKVFADANRTLPQTKDEFIKLFTSLDIRNNIEDQKTFALLLNNTENFNELLSLQEEIIGQNKVNLEDLKKSLLDFRSSLLLGATSVLSPTERYALAKKEFENTVTRAIVDKDPEALKQLQNSSQTFLNLSRELYASGSQYVSDFNSVLKALDDATAITSSQINLAAEQLKVTNEQLGALRNIERLLEESNELRTIPTTPEDRRTTQSVTGGLDLGNVPSYVTTIDIGGQKFMRDASTGLWSIQPKAFGGYLGGGLALLGEMGPELVDFQTPGRVYTAEQTRGMFTPNFGNNGFQQMVAKLQEVQGELNQLRKEQQKQTGDMIVTNYDAQQKVAEEIVDAVMKSVKEKSWQDKNKPTIN